MTNVEKAQEAIMRSLDEESHPDKLSKVEYRELLQELLFDLEGRLDGVEGELKEEGEGG